MDNIILYSNNCPKCAIVKRNLKEKNISFEEINDLDEILKVARKIGVTSLPILLVDEKYFYGSKAVKQSQEMG